MLIFYLAVLIIGLYWATKMLAPEMAKPALPKTVPPPKTRVLTSTNEAGNAIEKVESLLAEKNKNINLLELELKFHRAQARSFDKIKTLLNEEINRLKEQNRIFRSELGIPTVQPKENSIR